MGKVYTQEGPVTLVFDGEGESTFSPTIAGADKCWYEYHDPCWWKYCWVQGQLWRWKLYCKNSIHTEEDRPEDPRKSQS
jgi:hypothetical protein